MAFPSGRRPLRVYFSVIVPAVVGQTSGLSITAPPGGKGAFVFNVAPEDGVTVGFNVTPVPILTDSLIDIEPTAKSRFDEPVACLIRRGYAIGSVAEPPFWYLFRGAFGIQLPSQGGYRGEIYIPPGGAFTLLKTVENDALEVSLGFEEL